MNIKVPNFKIVLKDSLESPYMEDDSEAYLKLNKDTKSKDIGQGLEKVRSTLVKINEELKSLKQKQIDQYMNINKLPDKADSLFKGILILLGEKSVEHWTDLLKIIKSNLKEFQDKLINFDCIGQIDIQTLHEIEKISNDFMKIDPKLEHDFKEIFLLFKWFQCIVVYAGLLINGTANMEKIRQFSEFPKKDNANITNQI